MKNPQRGGGFLSKPWQGRAVILLATFVLLVGLLGFSVLSEAPALFFDSGFSTPLTLDLVS